MTDELIGRRIGGYEILDLIGRGGMATVYRAQQVSMNRIVALKVLPRHLLDDATYLQRFHREVKIIAQLEHRSICPVHDYGEENGQPYIAMRYMAGGSVDDRLRDGPLPVEMIVRIIAQIAPALDYAHAHHVLHRDLKPSNILLDDDGGAYLTDFGIARILGEVSSTLTTQGVVGTPSYMSPEQAQGLPLDARSDIYSLGVTLFEMATGRRPFESETPYGVAVMHVTTPPPSPRSFNPNLPAAVENVILTALSKNRDSRYADAAALAAALERAVDYAALNIHDTQPGFARPEMPASSPLEPMADYVPPAPPPGTTTGSLPPIERAPVESARWRRVRAKGSANLLISALVGGLLGCGLLALVTLAAVLIISESERRSNVIATDEALAATETAANAPTETPASLVLTPARTGETIPGVVLTDEPLAGPPQWLIYAAERGGQASIYQLNLTTRVETQLTDGTAAALAPAPSPDGTRIAFIGSRGGVYDLYVMNADGSGVVRLTDNGVDDRAPTWTPDGAWIVFSTDTRGGGAHDLVRIRPDGTDLEVLLSGPERTTDPSVSPDGALIAYTAGSPVDASRWAIWQLDLRDGTTAPLTTGVSKNWAPVYAPDGTIFFQTMGEGFSAIARMDGDGRNREIVYDGPGFEWGIDISPNGRFIVFTSDATGRDELYVMTIDGDDVQAVTSRGALGGRWLP
ncbi:MAG: protein kinase [Aggregatilineales bacterium]